MSTAWHALLTALGWVLTGYIITLAVFFACLIMMVLAALLSWEPRRRMPTDGEWEQTLAAWTREVKDDRNERGAA